MITVFFSWLAATAGLSSHFLHRAKVCRSQPRAQCLKVVVFDHLRNAGCCCCNRLAEHATCHVGRILSICGTMQGSWMGRGLEG